MNVAGIDTPIELWAVVVVVLGGIVSVCVTSYQNRSQSSDIRAIREQTENTHTTNLRDDIDDIRHGVNALRDDIRGLHKDIGRLRGEISDERAERIAGDAQHWKLPPT